MSVSEKFYITTTLPYVNSDPHIGFALEIIQADAIARYQRLLGKEVTFNTGTDEHGVKIYRKALELGKDPQLYCDEYAAKFDALKSGLNLSYDRFIRTTDVYHMEAAQEFWKKCRENGDIYKKNYSVKYCVGCELEKTESELEDGKCPVHPKMELETIDEENYFFRFSRYQQQLLDLYRNCFNFVRPSHRLTEIVHFTEKGLEDFSISRLKRKMPWGVPVPDDPDHVMYVWFDALVNYISTLGWPKKGSEFDVFWPGVQIAGKDNLRQQSNMWQAMLLSAGIQPSREILIHGFITCDGQKMSKSLGNVVDPFTLAGQFGIDPLRYYLLKEIPTAEDGDFSQQRFIELYRTDLANDLGNLVYRVLSMTEKYFDGKVPESGSEQLLEIRQIDTWVEEYRNYFADFDLKKAIEIVMEIVSFSNEFVEQHRPWQLAKEDTGKLSGVMYTLLELLRFIAVLLLPFLPQTAEKIFFQLRIELGGTFEDLTCFGVLEKGSKIAKSEPLFPRAE